MHSTRLFAEKVMPKLRNVFPEYADDGRFWCKPLAKRAKPAGLPGALRAESELAGVER